MKHRRYSDNLKTDFHVPVPYAPTKFELFVAQHQLTEAEFLASKKLKAWVLENRNSCYVPEYLLEAWKIEVKVWSLQV